MDALYLLVPISVLLVFVALWIFSRPRTTASSTTWSARRCAFCRMTTSRRMTSWFRNFLIHIKVFWVPLP